jgi:hypothetical protein
MHFVPRFSSVLFGGGSLGSGDEKADVLTVVLRIFLLVGSAKRCGGNGESSGGARRDGMDRWYVSAKRGQGDLFAEIRHGARRRRSQSALGAKGPAWERRLFYWAPKCACLY